MSIAPMNRPVSYQVTGGSYGSSAVRGSVAAAPGGVAARQPYKPPPTPAPKPAAQPAKPYVNPFTQPIQSTWNDMRPDWAKQGLPNPNQQQDNSNRNETWQPPQPPAMPSSPGTSPPPLEMPGMGGAPQAYDAGEGWDTSGPTDVGQGLGQRHLPASMSALADAARLY